MSSITSWGRSNFVPLRENMAFFKGFQNPRIPSYFSNTHLKRKGPEIGNWIKGKGAKKNTNGWDRCENWWRNKDEQVLQYLQSPWYVWWRCSQEVLHWSWIHHLWSFHLESIPFDVVWLLLPNWINKKRRSSGYASAMEMIWFNDYLSIRLSHQNGMLINVIPALFASSCFILSLAFISSNVSGL